MAENVDPTNMGWSVNDNMGWGGHGNMPWGDEGAGCSNSDDYTGWQRRTVLAALCVSECEEKKKQPRKYWVNPLLQKRKERGFYEALYPILHVEDKIYHNYFRMTATQLEELLGMVGDQLQKQIVVREPISAKERLLLTLRYLASGDSLVSMHYQYLVSTQTASSIVKETCATIWNKLQPIVLPSDLKKKDWLDIANVYKERWDFPHCLGSIDGKHVNIQCPNKGDSQHRVVGYLRWPIFVSLC